MPPPRSNSPSYVRYSNGQARIVWRDAAGTRRFKVLPGKYDSPESRAAFHRLCLELATSPAPKMVVTDPGPAVAEALLLPYVRYAERYYGPSSELEAVRVVVKLVRALYGPTPAAEFGPKALAAVREAMVQKGWSRQYVNRQVRRVVRMAKWAAAEELIPATVFQALKTLGPLRRGKTTAPEARPRVAANQADVAATLPFLPPHVRALVELIRLTGMRPGEACRMTLGEIDRSGAVWVYAPARHKTEYKGRRRPIALGAAAQAIIVAHLGAKVLGTNEPCRVPPS